MLIAATVGCMIATFVLLSLFFKFIVGLLYPFVAVGLIFGVHRLLVTTGSGQPDPRHYKIQYAVIVGGTLSVGLAYMVSSGTYKLSTLGYTALVMAGLALFSILLDQMRSARSRRAAAAAIESARHSRQLIQLGEPTEALEQLQEALLVCETAHGSYSASVAAIVFDMAQALRALGRKLPAKLLLARTVGVYARLGFDRPGALQSLHHYVEHLLVCREYELASNQAQLLVFQTRKVSGEDADFGRARLLLSRVLQAEGKLEEAYQSSQSAVVLLEKFLGKNDKETVRAKAVLANQTVLLGRVAEGERLIREAIAGKEQRKETDDAEFLGLLLDHYTVLERSGSAEAGPVFRRALLLFRTEIGPDYSRADELLTRLPVELKREAPEEFHAFYDALVDEKSTPAREVLQKHPNLSAHVDNTGWTALQWAIFLGRNEIAERLISMGADHSVGAGTDYPPLFIAARWSRKSLIAALFRKDADIEIEAVEGSRPIHAAVRSGDQFTFDTIASRSARIDPANSRGWTALHEAAHLGQRKLLIQLITKGGEVNFQGGTHRETPLHAAILGGHCSTVETLILNAANLSLKDADGFTPYELAESLGNAELVELLSSHLDTSADSPGEVEEESSESEQPADSVEAPEESEQESELEMSSTLEQS